MQSPLRPSQVHECTPPGSCGVSPYGTHGDLRLYCLPGAVVMLRCVAPDTYISTACRNLDHQNCRDHPVVRCACECHEGQPPWVDPRKQGNPGEVGGYRQSADRRAGR